MTKEEILKLLLENKAYLKKKFGVKKIALFGSFSRNEANEKSDIDLIVDMPSSFKNYFELKYFLENLLKRRVDLGLQNSVREYIKEKIQKDLIYV
ncbi:nucleotidyltransferase family protein [Caminibacter pacificus]|jgi:predicted nucleotidyltransferase|uniref:Nucleotidyltransferase family protein n=1 Tax=Caminibacter pacificus TaxID=1424653 RepID=A0AAJ4RE16_9BACT|nr:nucleotidyltransferase family protein [Caminibacter pacificus]QCI28400.1 nucleotidyltransferase family protein [Caminibacter pacificus]ROR40876.1 hypothetical protein EDC58_0357 [Caminibacter pacificus]